LVKCHWFRKSDYILGCKVTYGINKAQASTLDKYTISLGVNLDAIEALIQYVVAINQPFTICDEVTFKALYTSCGTICPITNADSLHNAIRVRFQGSRSELKLEMAIDCKSFSISFDR
jgi:hypothetical protein